VVSYTKKRWDHVATLTVEVKVANSMVIIVGNNISNKIVLLTCPNTETIRIKDLHRWYSVQLIMRELSVITATNLATLPRTATVNNVIWGSHGVVVVVVGVV